MKTETELQELKDHLFKVGDRQRENQDTEELDRLDFAYGLLCHVLDTACPAAARAAAALARWQKM